MNSSGGGGPRRTGRRRRARVLVIAFAVGASTIGIPGQAFAVSIPPTLDATIAVPGGVVAAKTLTRTLVLPWRANMIGVSFASSARAEETVTVFLRPHQRDGWDAWRAMRIDVEDAPDGIESARANRRLFTDPQWVGAADRVQVRVAAARTAPRVTDVRIHALNTAGDARDENVFARALHAIARILTATASTGLAPADAHAPIPSIITRHQWGADESWRDSAPRYAPAVKMVFVHHTDNPNSYTRAQSAAIVRGIYRYHTHSRGFADIAYNFLIDRYGQTFEGRAGGMTQPVIGAHTLGFNTGTTGVALIGTFSSVNPPRRMITSLERLLAWKMDVHHIPPAGRVRMISGGSGRYPPGTAVTFNRISGHRDGTPTDCPGNKTYARLPAIRRTANAIGNPKIFVPALDSAVLRPDGDGLNDGPVTLRARLSRSGPWTVRFLDRSGGVLREQSGRGNVVVARWDGRDPGGADVSTGAYSWSVGASDSNGHAARPASGFLSIVRDHPSGTALEDATSTYIVGGLSRTDVGTTAYASRFAGRHPVPTGPGERTRYAPSPAPLGLRDGTVLRVGAAPSSEHFIWSGGALRQFAVEPVDAYQALAYEDEAAFEVTQAFVDGLGAQGPPVTDTTAHPPGTVITDGADGYWVVGATERNPLSQLALDASYRAHEPVSATGADMAMAEGLPAPVREGTVVAALNGREPWLVTATGKRRFVSTEFFTALGYTPRMLVRASRDDLTALPSEGVFG